MHTTYSVEDLILLIRSVIREQLDGDIIDHKILNETVADLKSKYEHRK